MSLLVIAAAMAHEATLAGPIVIATLWQGFALATLVAFCLRLAPRATATLRFTLWSAALIFLCFLPLAAMAPAPSSRTLLHLDPRWSLILAALWLTLSLLRAVDLGRHAFRLLCLSRDAQPVILNPALGSLLHTHRKAQLCTSDQLDCPGVIGFLRPRILIPAWLFDQLTAPELEQIVLHELEHLRRRDDWLNLVQKLALVAFPLNPVLYWIERRLCLERELACDEGVIRRTRAPRLYAACLVRLAERGLDHRALSLALGFLERQSELARRVAGVLRAPRTPSLPQNLAFGGTVAVILLGGSIELARCPQLVSFAAPAVLATNLGETRLAPELSVSRSNVVPVLYTGGASPRLLQATFNPVQKPLHKLKVRRPHPLVTTHHALSKQAAPPELLATGLAQPAPLTPTLVRYTFVHVDGGWLLLQL